MKNSNIIDPILILLLNINNKMQKQNLFLFNL